jgi:hypothetical protein
LAYAKIIGLNTVHALARGESKLLRFTGLERDCVRREFPIRRNDINGRMRIYRLRTDRQSAGDEPSECDE